MNESVCRTSMLNFASRNAENTAIRKASIAINHPLVYIPVANPCAAMAFSNMKYIIEARATPKLTISANESSSFPMSE